LKENGKGRDGLAVVLKSKIENGTWSCLDRARLTSGARRGFPPAIGRDVGIFGK